MSPSKSKSNPSMNKTSNVVSLSAQRSQLDYKTIRMYDHLLGPSPSETEGPVLRLTEEGQAYYGWWFKKFGFTLTQDANEFFESVKAIARTLREEQFPEDSDSIVPASVAMSMPIASRELVDSINQAVRTGELPQDWSQKREAAKRERAACSAEIVPFKHQ